MSLQIVQNQQLKPIGDKVPIDTTLSSSSENAISNKAVSDEITRINSDLTDRQFIFDQTDFGKLGLTSTSSFTDICNKLLTQPFRNSELLLWVNNDTTAGATIKREVDRAFSTNIFGYAVFKAMRADFVQITFYGYVENGHVQEVFCRNFNYINSSTPNYSKWMKYTMTQS